MTEPSVFRRWAVPLAVAAYFALLLLAKVVPSLGQQGYFLVYVLTLPVLIVVLVVLGVWGLVGWMRAGTGGTTSPRHRAFMRVAVVGLAAAFASTFVSRSIENPLPEDADDLPFDSAAWQAPRADMPGTETASPRQKMLAAVVRDVLPGRDRAAIVAALGEPETTTAFDERGADLTYRLGPQRPIGLDHQWLLIELDAGGRYASHVVRGD